MCGLIGHIGSKTNPVNIDKLNILGIMNEVRGTHSCGVTADGEILKGTKSLSKYRDFISYYDLNVPKHTRAIIGHTRKATLGEHTKYNAHPFGFGKTTVNKKEVFQFVGVHNGTLHNHSTLAETGKVKASKEVEIYESKQEKGATVTKKYLKTVFKIDSEILLERLYKDKDFSVLTEYNGAAALIWQWVDKPDTAYFFHGKSQESSYDKKLVEERPLYYWKENKNSLYVSSIAESLYAIGGSDDTIGEFKHNTVYEIKNGNIAKAKLYPVDRTKCYKAKIYNTHNTHSVRNFQPGGRATNCRISNIKRGNRGYKAKALNNLNKSQYYKLNLEVPVDKGLLEENFDINPNTNGGLTVCKQLRHWRTGHKAEGIYFYVKNHGFYYLSDKQDWALKHLEATIVGKYFYDKSFYKQTPDSGEEIVIPLSVKKYKENGINLLHYFYDGIRLKSYADYKQLKSIKDNDSNFKFDVVALSHAAAHPIIDLSDKDRIKGVYFNGELITGTISFLGSRKNYTFKEGEVKKIEYIKGMEPDDYNPDDTTYTTFQEASNYLDKTLKVNGYVNLKEKEYLKEMAELDDVITNMRVAGATVKKVSDRIESQIDNILLDGFAETNPDYRKIRANVHKYTSGSTKAELACNILTELITLKED